MDLGSNFLNIIQDYRMKPEGLPNFEARLFFEGAQQRPFLVRFSTLLVLSTIIASGGVLNDSTATVIGAMIIAPLMIPMMATAAAMVMGDMSRVWRSLKIVIFGMALVIFASWLIGIIYVGPISYAENTQIVSRTSPRLTDLVIALASGAAGAFAMSRDDVDGTLPGVAIAVSLVPPLCVVGISLSDLEMASANGAMRLFLTNFLSILLAGGGTLAVLGLGSVAARGLKGRSRRRAFVAVVVGIVLLSVPLAVTGYSLTSEAFAQDAAYQATEEWLSGTSYVVQDVAAYDDKITIWISGYGSLPDTSGLVSALEPVEQEMLVTLDVLESEEVQLVLKPSDESD